MNTTTYTIYIRYGARGGNNKTKPGNQASGKGANPTKPSKIVPGNDDMSASDVIGFINTVKNPMSALIGSASKALAPIAITLACAKVADNVISAALPIYEGLTGDSSIGINYSNFKSTISAITNPFGTINDFAQKQVEIYRANLKVNEQRALTGNSTINTYGGKSSN